ncbi:non-homologous end-joining DNA ligase [Agromyces seonyuensis]|uniref:ATP-dependent DNA ligase n=1 Tax=Agromyces seonyuensis TaxID=2662446 RepID=A0A6I4NW81_9MICO|nr:non-homologous end-joining DNA ligase [Agromyces seonyuensis]MWB98391.1 ATP-dependent DNA ligase [Agromyces seonyuensis]
MDGELRELDGPDGPRQVRLTHPERVIWPDAGVTKGELADYVEAVAEPMLRAIGDRPVSLERVRGSIQDETFFSKNPPKGTPEWVRASEVTYPSGRSHPQLVLDEPASLVWAVQMNTVVFHPWPSRAAASDLPDQLRIDLDPQPGTDFGDAVDVARALQTLLVELGFDPFVKTSGGRGLHVFAPLAPEHEFLDVRHGVIALCRRLEARMPDRVTTAWWKEERGERIFLDYNQANRDRTMAGAYSPRARPGAPVSCPVAWDELEGLDPSAFSVRTVPARLRERGDAWEGFAAARPGVLAPLLEAWEADLSAGLGELPFPPDFPKMPGEPPRVQPSRRKAE